MYILIENLEGQNRVLAVSRKKEIIEIKAKKICKGVKEKDWKHLEGLIDRVHEWNNDFNDYIGLDGEDSFYEIHYRTVEDQDEI